MYSTLFLVFEENQSLMKICRRVAKIPYLNRGL